ncbi:MAG: hypothetical protein EBR60_09860 [Burkholderiaceae bacterium]|nr:hypothetical protein [Burkholderiaceae bacterium]
MEKKYVGSQQISSHKTGQKIYHERRPSESSAFGLNKAVSLVALLITLTNNSNNASLPTLKSLANWEKMPE